MTIRRVAVTGRAAERLRRAFAARTGARPSKPAAGQTAPGCPDQKGQRGLQPGELNACRGDAAGRLPVRACCNGPVWHEDSACCRSLRVLRTAGGGPPAGVGDPQSCPTLPETPHRHSGSRAVWPGHRAGLCLHWMRHAVCRHPALMRKHRPKLERKVGGAWRGMAPRVETGVDETRVVEWKRG